MTTNVLLVDAKRCKRKGSGRGRGRGKVRPTPSLNNIL